MSEAPLKVDANKVVTFHYHLSDTDGSFAESSEGKAPVTYMHGHNAIVPGLESELAGRASGDKVSVTVAPQDAYGHHDPSAVQRVPLKHLVGGAKPAVGDMVAVNTQHGVRHARVLMVGHFNVDLDWNLPLAGETRKFEIEIVEVRDATEEELAHGHAHGPGGHHH
jgi:FKBP-type peptidyl-prolyl cis-trans isomerase SlyD